MREKYVTRNDVSSLSKARLARVANSDSEAASRAQDRLASLQGEPNKPKPGHVRPKKS